MTESKTTSDMQQTQEEQDPGKPVWGMITNDKDRQYYKKPHGFGVLLNATHLAKGLWIEGDFKVGFTYDLKEQKFGFCIPKEESDRPTTETQGLETIQEDSTE